MYWDKKNMLCGGCLSPKGGSVLFMGLNVDVIMVRRSPRLLHLLTSQGRRRRVKCFPDSFPPSCILMCQKIEAKQSAAWHLNTHSNLSSTLRLCFLGGGVSLWLSLCSAVRLQTAASKKWTVLGSFAAGVQRRVQPPWLYLPVAEPR